MNMDPKELAKNAEDVATILKKLSNPYRLMILCCISENELTVGDLNKQVDLSQSALSQHLAKLRASNIVATRRESQTIYYRIADDRVKELLVILQEKFCPQK
ncbi:ArsR/SmtB family transcription factor [Litorilituus sediminis]|uniref:ArsR family transcriptional regulator n=1 Tax=Litorilituus sediminis TaxID=718192 RepID=A0A4P6PA76_9GAMM|nr:metalloregulator ArsR/SmtB family transcription factor [Litorilituus sediminis]QBG37219.1 ArsR family transcriptional regulator [Litorilituus sediminis]